MHDSSSSPLPSDIMPTAAARNPLFIPRAAVTMQSMPPSFKLRFDHSEITHLASRYMENLGQADKELEDKLLSEVGPATRRSGHLTREAFLEMCRWKSKRTQKHCAANHDAFIRAVSATALGSENERLRIEVLTLLCGVEWPTASVILHFCANDRYPILDFRALWSLSVDVPKAYDFDFWWQFTEFSRRLADEASVSMRALDRALWQYSKENQPPSSAKAQSIHAAESA